MSIPFPVVFFLFVNSPLYGLVICITFAMVMDQPKRTSCANAPELLPSISMVIGTEPQETLWQAVIGCSTPFRVAVGFLYYRYGDMHLKGGAFFFFILELTFLCVLTCITSAENFTVHSTAFYAFAATSSIAMLLNSIQANETDYAKWSSRTALITKRAFSCVYLLLLGSAYYLYRRHEEYCQPYSYTVFAFSEYAVVLCNIAYHGCALFDFWDLSIPCYVSSSEPSRRNPASKLQLPYTKCSLSKTALAQPFTKV